MLVELIYRRGVVIQCVGCYSLGSGLDPSSCLKIKNNKAYDSSASKGKLIRVFLPSKVSERRSESALNC